MTRLPLAFASAAILFSFSTAATHAQTVKMTSVTIPSATIADGKRVRGTSPDKIKSSGKYLYTVSGSVLGKGALSSLAPKYVPIATFLNGLKPGSGNYLINRVATNTSGSLPYIPFNRTFSGTRTIQGLGSVSFTMRIKASIAADGLVSFTIDNVRIRNSEGQPIAGSLALKNARITVYAASTIEVVSSTTGTIENTTNRSISLNVRRYDSLHTTATVQYATVDGTAKANVDYEPLTGKITFEPGESVKTITIPVINNAVKDGIRTFQLVISSPSSNAQLGVKTVTNLNIRDDD